MLHRLEATDHRLDPGADLLVLLQEVGPLGDQVVLAVAQRAVLFLELLHGGDELVQSALEAAQLGIDRGFCGGIVHMPRTIGPPRRGSN